MAIVFSYIGHNKEITKKLLREKNIRRDTFLEHARAITRAEADMHAVKGEKTAVNIVHKNNNNPPTPHKAKHSNKSKPHTTLLLPSKTRLKAHTAIDVVLMTIN